MSKSRATASGKDDAKLSIEEAARKKKLEEAIQKG
jgi:tRNA C32,U32 (ribose-2'-O)-methylase TrmJ